MAEARAMAAGIDVTMVTPINRGLKGVLEFFEHPPETGYNGYPDQ